MCLGSYKGYGVMLYRSNCHYFVKISASVDRKNKLLLKSIARKAKELCRRVIFNQCSGDFIIFLILSPLQISRCYSISTLPSK